MRGRGCCIEGPSVIGEKGRKKKNVPVQRKREDLPQTTRAKTPTEKENGETLLKAPPWGGGGGREIC